MNDAAGRGVLLIGHGTRSEAGAAEFFALRDRVQQLLPDAAVEAGFLELRAPSIAQAWQRLTALPVGRIDAVPLLLFAAGHARQDIPAALAACASPDRPVTLRLTRPLSRHRALIALAAARATEAVQAAGAADLGRTALVVVGRGNYDPCARTDLRLLVETVSRSIRPMVPLAAVEAAFYAMAEPPLTDVLAHQASGGSIDTVVVQPLLLFDGQVKTSICRQVAQAARRYPAVRFHVGEHLAADPLLAQAVAGRLAELPCCCT